MNKFRASLAVGGLSLATLVGCSDETPRIVETGEGYELNQAARAFLADAEELNAAIRVYDVVKKESVPAREYFGDSLRALSEAEIDEIPQEMLARGYDPEDPHRYPVEWNFGEWADKYVAALRTCGANEEILAREEFTLVARQVLCAHGVPSEYSSSFAEVGPLKEYRERGVEEGMGFAETIVFAHRAGMTLEDFTAFDGVWKKEKDWNPYGWLRISFFGRGLSGSEYAEYPQRFWDFPNDVWDLYRNGIMGPQAAQWGECLWAHEIIALARENYPEETSRKLCAIAEEYGVEIHSDDMLWFEEQDITLDQVRTAARDEYRDIRQRIQ